MYLRKPNNIRSVITVIALLLSTLTYSQPALTGKWKPVFFSLDALARGDVKADTIFISDKIKEIFKDDKNPGESEEMMKFIFEMLFKKMKDTQEEYLSEGKYIETNTRTGRSKTGTYIYDEATKSLERKQDPSNKKENFIVSWKNGQLVLTGDLESTNGKKGKIEIVYEKL